MPQNDTSQDPAEAETPSASASALKRQVRIRSLPLTGIYLLAIFYTIYLARPFLLPLVLAILFSYLLAPLVRQLSRAKIPPWAGAGIVLVGVLAAIIVIASAVIAPAAAWMSKAPYSLTVLEEKFRPLREPVKKIKEASEQITDLAKAEEKKPGEVVVEVKAPGLLEFIMSQTAIVAAQTAAVIVLIYFMLAYGNVLLNKTIHVIHRLRNKKRAVEIARRVEYSVSHYLLMITLINFGMGAAIGLLVGLCGMPSPMLWGLIAALANYIPYVGAAGGILCITLAAVLSFDLPHALLFPGIYFICNSIEGSFVTPLLLGRSFTLNPVVIIVGLLFGGWIWGIVGMFVTVPLLVILKAFAENIESLHPLDEFLSR